VLLHHSECLELNSLNVGKLNKTLNICNIDLMAYKFLLPWLRALQGYTKENHLACCFGACEDKLARENLVLHPLPIQRTWNPFRNLGALIAIIRLLRSDRWDIVVVHSPIAAALVRTACFLTGYRPVMYVMHGMYATENTRFLARILSNTVERVLASVTDSFQFVSAEDLATARRCGILKRHHQAFWGCVGVSASIFSPDPEIGAATRERLDIPVDAIVVGVVARLVREKGFAEFFSMAREIAATEPSVRFLIVGDNLPSDRDGISLRFRQWINDAGIADRFVFVGFTDAVSDYLNSMDMFVLPTYREGFPVSVMEAMSTGLPVVTTSIRGCREAVVDGVTGLLVPPHDSPSLTEAVLSLIRNEPLRRAMGEAGRRRIIENFEQKSMADLFVKHVLAAYRVSSETPINC